MANPNYLQAAPAGLILQSPVPKLPTGTAWRAEQARVVSELGEGQNGWAEGNKGADLTQLSRVLRICHGLCVIPLLPSLARLWELGC